MKIKDFEIRKKWWEIQKVIGDHYYYIKKI